MVTHYDKKTIEDFQTRLNQLDAGVPNTFSLRDVVAESLESIQQARNRHISWDAIAQLLQQSAHANGNLVEIHASTVRKYFLALTSRSRTAPRKKAARAESKKVESAGPSVESQFPSTETPGGQLQAQPEPELTSLLETSLPSQMPQPQTESETISESTSTESNPSTQTSTDSTMPTWTTTGWTEPTFNRNRARPKSTDNPAQS